MAKESKEISCPNCLGPAIREGNDITCEKCDAVFVISKKNLAKVKQIGPIEDHEQRLKRLESHFPGQEPDPADLEPDPALLEPDPDDEESLLGPE